MKALPNQPYLRLLFDKTNSFNILKKWEKANLCLVSILFKTFFIIKLHAFSMLLFFKLYLCLVSEFSQNEKNSSFHSNIFFSSFSYRSGVAEVKLCNTLSLFRYFLGSLFCKFFLYNLRAGHKSANFSALIFEGKFSGLANFLVA
jgi:hypothetical protein